MTLYELRRELLIQIYLCESELKKASDPKTMHLVKSGNWESYCNIYTNILLDLDKEITRLENRKKEYMDECGTEDLNCGCIAMDLASELDFALGKKE